MSSSANAWKDLFPFESHRLALRNGWNLHYVDEGPTRREVGESPSGFDSPPAKDAPCVLAVHGNPTWSFYYRTVIGAMRTTHRAIAVDHLGMGWSDKPHLREMRLSEHTTNLVEFIERMDLRNIVLVVHDWGGAIGLGAAVQLPSRFAGLVVLNTAAFPPPYVPWRIAVLRTPWIGRWAMTYGNVFARAATRMTLHRLQRLDPEVKQGLLQPYDTPAHRIGIANFVQDIPLTPRHPTHATLVHLESKLPTLKHLPIRLVWGMKDWCFRPSCLERFQALWPDATTVTLNDVGHYVMEEASEDVIANIRSIVEGIENRADFE